MPTLNLKYHDMKIRHTELSDGINDPFENCKLDRKQYAAILNTLVENFGEGFVIALNNPWGAGKTTFVKMWEQDLQSKGYKTLYFNAWENDFEEKPLVAILAHLKTLTSKPSTKLFNQLIDKGKVLTNIVVPGVLKALISPYVSAEHLKLLTDGIAEGTGEILSEEIENYSKKQEGLKKFRDSLKAFVEASTTKYPLVFIIDELDRCRPNYAVELLENIKHLFSVEKIVFVLSIDKAQLCHAVKGVYGNDNIDAEEYLRRFIDIEYSLPDPPLNVYSKYLYDYFAFDRILFSEKRKPYEQYFAPVKRGFIENTGPLFALFNLNLRQQEKVMASLRITVSLFSVNAFIAPELLVFMSVWKFKDPSTFNRVYSRKYSLQQLINEFEKFVPDAIPKATKRLIMYIKARVVVFYHNGSDSGHEPLVNDNGDCALTSTLFQPNDFTNALKSVDRDEQRHYNLDEILKKINISEDFNV